MIIDKRSKINFPIIFRLIGWLLIMESAFMLIPLMVGFIYMDNGIQGLFLSIAITLVTGLIMALGIKPKYKNMGNREAILLTALIWALFSVFGMMPFIFSEPHLSLIDAFFEAVSGFTTTGATVIQDVEIVPKSILFWRSLMQWIGGMGIILFTLAVLPMLNHQGGIQLFHAEVSGITHDKLRPRISQTAKSLWAVYLVLTILEIIFLTVGPMDFFDAICQTFSTLSTGGFSTRNDSIEAWHSWYINGVILVFMFLGAVNFQLLYRVGEGDFKSLFKNDTFRWYCLIILLMLIAISTILILHNSYTSWEEYVFYPLFAIVSGMSSTGFAITNFEGWGDFALLLFFVMMYFGGCAGSTTSGAKIDRFILLVKNTKNQIYKILHPNSILTVRVNGKVVPYEIVTKTIAFLAIFSMALIFFTAILTLCNISLVDSFFAAISCLSNIGNGYGFTGVNGSFANINDIGKIFLTAAMIMGRLELFTFLVIFTKDFWSK